MKPAFQKDIETAGNGALVRHSEESGLQNIGTMKDATFAFTSDAIVSFSKHGWPCKGAVDEGRCALHDIKLLIREASVCENVRNKLTVIIF